MTENDKFDAIILSYGKGSDVIWNSHAEAKSFTTMRDFNNFSVIPVNIVDENRNPSYVENAGKFLHELKRRHKNVDNNPRVDSSHNSLFGIASEAGSNAFWQWQEDKKYTFVTLVQFGYGFESMFKSRDYLKSYLNNYIEEQKTDFRYFIYYSLEISDFIIFMATDNLEDGRKCIFNFRREFCHNFYSYTTFGFDLSSPAVAEDDTELAKLIICFPIENPKKYQEWAAALLSKYPKTTFETIIRDRLGHEDISINILKIKMKDVVKELSDGLLSHNDYKRCKFCTQKTGKVCACRGYKGAISRPRIIFDSDFDTECARDNYTTRISVGVNTIYAMHNNKISDIVTILKPHGDDKQERRLSDVQKAFHNMLKAVSMLEDKHFARDIAACVNATYPTFIRDVQREIALIDESAKCSKVDTEANYMLLHESIHKYINANMSLIQGALQADTVFFQAPGFHVSLYEAPSKLIVFYMAFVKRLQDAMEKRPADEFRVDVVFNIGLHTHASVSKIFDPETKKDNRRHTLLEIKIPMSMLFVPHRLLPQLAHELAHFSQINDLRCRKPRFALIIDALSTLVADEFFNFESELYDGTITKEQKDIISGIITEDEMLTRCKTVVSQSVAQYFRFNLEHILNNSDDYTLSVIRDELGQKLCNFLSPNNLEDLMSELLNTIDTKKRGINFDIDLFGRHLNIFVQILYTKATKLIMRKSKIAEITSLMGEIFADFMMIKACKVSKDLYFNTIFEVINTFYRDTEGYEFEEILKKNYNLQRFCSVAEILYKDDFKSDKGYFENVLSGVNLKNDKTRVLKQAMENIYESDIAAFYLLTGVAKAYLSKCEFELTSKPRDFNSTSRILQSATNNGVGISDFLPIFYNEYDYFINDYQTKTNDTQTKLITELTLKKT